MWPQSNPRKKRSSIGQLGVATLALLTAFTFLPGMLPFPGSLPEAEAQAPPAPTWDFVAEIPGAQDGRFARKIWTAERDVLYVLTMTSSVPFDMQVWRFDRGAWHLELDLPGHYGNFVFGTGPDDVYAGGYTCLQPDGSWTCPAGGADASPVYHFDGAGWSQLAMPPELDGRNVHSIAGVPGEVQIGAGNRYVVRDNGAGWEVVYDANPGAGLTVGPSVMTMLAADEGYFASCWGHAWWDGNTWTKKLEFDFCDLYDMWGARTAAGDLNLWTAGNNNFQNGVRIWRYADAPTRSFGTKNGFEFGDPPTGTAQKVGTASALWGAAPDDVYATGCMWSSPAACDQGRIYHSTGDGSWTELTGMGPLASVADVWGTAADDVWFSLVDGQLLHYGTAPSYPALPWFNVDPDGDWMWGHGWTPGAALALDIDGTGFGATVDGNGDWSIDTRPFDLGADQRVVADDGTFTKSLVVTELTITGVDEGLNLVTGTAAPGSAVQVGIHEHPDVQHVTADPSGNWVADFSPFDIVPGTGGYAHQMDPDGDFTHPHWWVPKPHLGVDAGRDDVFGHQFAYPATVTVSVNGTPVATADTDESGHFGTPPLGVDIVVGDTVSADDGANTASHVVLALQASAADEAADTVTGTAPNGSQVDVWVHDVADVHRTVFAGPSDTWTADFTAAGATHPNDRGSADLVPGSNGNSSRCDAEGNCTYSQWRIADPYITASVIHEEVWATDWPDEPAGQVLHYRLEDGGGIVFESDMPLIVNAWGTEAGDRSFGRFDVAAGQTLTVRNRPFDQPLDGGVERVLAISHIVVTGVDADLDTITGYADPSEGGYVCVWSQNTQLCSDEPGFTWNPDGTWVAAFTDDIVPGHWNSASQFESDGDETHFWWNLPPWVVVELAQEDATGTPLWPDAVRAEQWTGPTVTLTINGSPVDTWTVTGDGHHTFELPGFDIEPGHVVTLSDSVDTKSVTVEPLAIDQINFSGDTPPNTVYGTAASQRNVRVEATAAVGGWWAERWVNADNSGAFIADFGIPGTGWREQWIAELGGAEGLGRHMRAEVYDEDNDRVETRTCEGVPRIEVIRSDGRVDAYDFPEGATVTLTITGAPDPFTATSERNPDNPCETIATFDLGGFEIPDDATVTASDDAGTPPVSHTVITFTIELVDPATDTVSGMAPAGIEVLVEAHGHWRYVVACDGSAEFPCDGAPVGTWIADFSTPGAEPGEEQVVDLAPGSSGRAIVLDADGSTTVLSWRISAASFAVDPFNEGIWGNDFQPDGLVDVAANGAPVPGSPFGTDSNGNFGTGWDPGQLDLQPGDLIVVSDVAHGGTTTKDHTITNLTITSVDAATDTIAGYADPGSTFAIWVHSPDNPWRSVTAGPDRGDGFGDWTVTFAVPGPNPGEETTYDLQPGDNGNSHQCDPENDCTQVGWQVRNPRFMVDANNESVWGWDFEPGSQVGVTANGTAVPGSPFGTDAWGNFGTGWDPTQLDLQPGDYMQAFDGTTTKDHTITNLTAAADPDTDTVSGTATGGAKVCVDVFGWGQDCTTAEGSGGWSILTNTEAYGYADLQPGSQGNAFELDGDDDATHVNWRVSNPSFQVDPYSEGIWGNEWPPGAEVTFTAHGTTYGPYLPDGSGHFSAGFDPAELDLQSGDLITMTDGVTTKDHTITNLAITSVDAATDTIAGHADPGSTFDIWVHSPDNPWRSVTVGPDRGDGFGDWTVTFAVAGPNPGEETTHHLQPGDNGNSHQCDDDGDCTQVGWQVRNPTFSVRMSEQQVHGYEWDEGVPVTLTIDDPTNGPGIDYGPVSATPGPAEWDPSQTFVVFAPLDDAGFEVQAEFEVTMTDGTTTKAHTVSPLEVTEIDGDADTVSGVASPEAWVNVHIHDTGVGRDVQADPGGNWTADFGNPGSEPWEQETYDIEFGTEGEANETDDDSDNTNVQWRLVNPTFTVDAEGDWVAGDEWAANAPITVTFEGGFVATSATDDGGHFDLDLWEQYDIQANRLVTVTDGAQTKTHVVTEVAVTAVDADTDTVTGTAGPGATVEVEVHTPLEGMVWEHLVFQLGPGRFDRNPDSWNEHLEFRQAVAHAIDKDAILAAVPNGGYVIDSYVDAYLPAVSGHAWEQYGYDPAAAQSLIDGLCATLGRDCAADPPVAFFTTTDAAHRQIIADQLDVMLGAVGIEVVVRLEDGGTFFGPTINDGTFDLGEWAWADQPTYDGLRNFHQAVDPDERWSQNWYRFGTPDSAVQNAATAELADVIGLMHTTDDPELLEGYVATAEQILADELAFIPLYVRAETFEVEGSTRLTVTANELGEWTADFSGVFDLVPGTEGSASEYDDDGDSTRANWRVPNPAFVVSATHDLVAGGEFEPGGTATITFDDNEDPLDGVLFETTTELDPDEGGFLVPLADDFDVQAGQFVTVADGMTTKATQVTEVAITDVDVGADHVAGTAAAGAEIEVEAEHAAGRSRRTVSSDGSWLADFSVSGEGDEAEPLDLRAGVIVSASEADDDGDLTLALGEIPAFLEGHVLLDGQALPSVEVFLAPDRFTCTENDGYFSFEGVSVIYAAITGGGFAATGPNPGSPCGNPAFVDADGKPLLADIYRGFDLSDGYEYVPFDVAHAAAYQTVLVEEFDGAGWVPLDEVPVHAYDRAVVGDPDPAQYPDVIAAGEGVLWSWMTTDGVGAEPRYGSVTDVLILVEMPDGAILGDQTAATEFEDRGDGVLVGPTIVFPNQPPVITEVAGPDFPLLLGTAASVAVEFTDPNAHDTHAVSFEWGDGTEPTGTGEHVYAAAGVYEVTVTVTDAGGLTATGRFRFVVVYDPSGGFATGGGWIHPHASSDYPGMDPTDKVNLGFNVKYKNGEPQGELNVQLGDMHVHSDSIDWLVITLENEAYFSGLATIDGGPDLYPFRVNVYDGDADIEADRFEMLLFTSGADPFDDPVLHYVLGDLQGGQVKIHGS